MTNADIKNECEMVVDSINHILLYMIEMPIDI